MEITIRPAIVQDAAALADCLISCWLTAYKGIVPDDFLYNMPSEHGIRTEKWIKAITIPDDCINYCVLCAEKIIGYLTIDIKIGEIRALYLIEECCGRGWGKALFDFAIDELRLRGHIRLFLWVFEDNHRARRFYEKSGFSSAGEQREVTYGRPLVQLKYISDCA